MLKIMLSKSKLCSKADCFIRVYQPFLTAVLEQVTALLEYLDFISAKCE